MKNYNSYNCELKTIYTVFTVDFYVHIVYANNNIIYANKYTRFLHSNRFPYS